MTVKHETAYKSKPLNYYILYYNGNYNNKKKNSHKPYTAVVVCLLVIDFCEAYLEFQQESALCPSKGEEPSFTDKMRITIAAFA